jgi:hypothetical protein
MKEEQKEEEGSETPKEETPPESPKEEVPSEAQPEVKEPQIETQETPPATPTPQPESPRLYQLWQKALEKIRERKSKRLEKSFSLLKRKEKSQTTMLKNCCMFRTEQPVAISMN